MEAERFTVRRLLQTPDSPRLVSMRDFTLDGPVPSSLETIKGTPNISLYAFDLTERRAIFVETSPAVDLRVDDLPFLYQRQRKHALPIHIVQLYRMAADVKRGPGQVVFLYSTGRCGSTLLEQILGKASSLVGLSEPDTFTQLILPAAESDRKTLIVSTSKLLQGGADRMNAKEMHSTRRTRPATPQSSAMRPRQSSPSALRNHQDKYLVCLCGVA